MHKQFMIFSTMLLALLSYSTMTLGYDKSPLITATLQKTITPDDALRRLTLGNQRFINQEPIKTDFLMKARLTADGQYPAAVVLSCIDSRVPPEIIFDQNIGNVFVTRVAANVINPDIIGGIEYATAVAGAKLIVVMAHESCGAVKGACDDVKLGHLTEVLAKVQPAISQTMATLGKKDCKSAQFINTVATNNVRAVIKMIPEQSSVIRQLVKEGKVKIVGAMYHLYTGKVTFFSK